jgi:hypothetical protein
MLLLIIAMAHTDSLQARHDNAEWAIYQRIKADQAAISEISHPRARLVSNYLKVQGRHVRGELYRAANCDAAFA